MQGYQAEPKAAEAALGSVLVIHENRGLNAHIQDVTRRLALAGYRAIAPDFLSVSGGTPADQDAARTAIGALDLTAAVADAVATLRLMKSLPHASGRTGAIGFCWGSGMVNRIAVAAGATLDAGIAFYGPAPAPELAAQVEAAMLLHFAERDERVNATGLPWAEALRAAGKEADAFIYAGTEHAFHNDTSAERYNEASARLAWRRSLDFLSRSFNATPAA
jgi:carboxymethylenebutenolidase